MVPELSKIPKQENDIINIISLIDNKIAKLAQTTYESIAYGMPLMDEYAVNDFITYKDILTQQLKGCGCKLPYPLSKIISKIKQLSA